MADGGEGYQAILSALAKRVEALEREVGALRVDNHRLRGGEEGPPERADSGANISRRSMLSRAGSVAVGAVAGAGLLQLGTGRVSASHPGGDEYLAVATLDAHRVIANRSSGDEAIYGDNGAGDGIHGLSRSGGAGVKGVGRAGVLGISSEWFGVWGRHTNNGPGVAGDSGAGAGVFGESQSGPALHGKSTANGYGGLFEGGKAQLRVVPKARTGKPASGKHSKGEIYMDSRGQLFVCTADGTPGTWRKVTTKAV